MKTILITGSTDGIGLETAKTLAKEGHNIIIHGRDANKIKNAKEILTTLSNGKEIKSYQADLSNMQNVINLAKNIKKDFSKLDVLINNAGIYKTNTSLTKDNLDIRFTVNTIAPYLLIKELVDILDNTSRVINLSSAAQAPVNLNALKGNENLSDSEAYAQSKLALTMWNHFLSHKLQNKIGVLVAINPASFLGSKMVKEAYGMEGKDINIGVGILSRAALSDEFKDASGKYFDNDLGRFSMPYPDALDMTKCEKLVDNIEDILKRIL